MYFSLFAFTISMGHVEVKTFLSQQSGNKLDIWDSFFPIFQILSLFLISPPYF